MAGVSRLTENAALRPFDLGKGPLIRTTPLELDKQDHVLLLVMHHILTDGWSMGVFNKELADLYQAYKMGLESPLEKLPIQYADYALWQRKWLQGEVLEKHLTYWKGQLAGGPALS